MKDFQKQNELTKTLNRFKKIRLLSNTGYNNLLPIEIFKLNSNKYQQVQLNTGFHFNAIIVDIDNEELLTEWNFKGLPTPTIQTVNKTNNKAHLIWLLNTPIWKKYAHVVKYYKAIVAGIKETLEGADKAYQNHQTKNFLNEDMYRVTYNDVAYDLGDFREFITSTKNIQGYDEFDYLVAGSRHIHLFELLRRYGYSIAKDSKLHEKLTQRAESINKGFQEAVKVKYIVKSVCRFCEENKNNFRNINNSKKMKFEKIKNLSNEEYKKEVHERQSKSAARTAEIKRLKTSTHIKAAIESLLRKKIKLTYSNIAKISRISLRTVKNHTKIVKFFTQKINGAISTIRMIVFGVRWDPVLKLQGQFCMCKAINLKIKGDKRCQQLISG